MSLVIDPLRFAKKSSTVSGTLNDFPRLTDDMILSAKIEYKLVGQGSVGDYKLILTLTGTVSAICQRCLEPMDVDVDIQKVYRLVPESQIEDEFDEDMLDDDEDQLPMGCPMPLLDLIEDELLLSLPTVPKHEDCHLVALN